jgi:hypothetical protein
VLIGIDFDNTIANYDDAFVSLAREMGFVPADFRGSKKVVRDCVRQSAAGDDGWQQLQARAYGRDIARATLASGVDEFLARARARRIQVVVVSHKTQFSPFDGATNLREAALGWMNDNGLFATDRTGVRPQDVYFEDTRNAKIERIKALGCTHFIDDLDDVFNEPAFPKSVQSYLYAAGYDDIPQGRFKAFRDHRQIADYLFGADAETTARALCGTVESVEPITRGRNNRLYKVTSNGRVFALKSYPAPDDDPRDRIGAEFCGLSFLKEMGERAVPAPVAIDRSLNVALYEWIDGHAIDSVSAGDLDRILALASRLFDYRRAPAAAKLPLASEACLSAAELVRQVTHREERLAAVAAGDPRLAGILQRLRAFRARATARLGAGIQTELAVEYRTLSPSDFGFHNALRRADGDIVFVDFEYFGWDDPVKLTADIMLHPGMRLDAGQRRHIQRGALAIFAEDPDFAARLGRLLPIYLVRWCLIILNEFLPERWARRVLAGDSDCEAVRTRQLEKADALVQAAPAILESLA